MRIPTSVAPDVAEAFRALLAKIDRFDGTQNIDLKGRRIINAGPAIDGFDYVTRADLDDAVAGLSEAEPERLSPAASGEPPTILYGLHDDRTALATSRMAEGTLFYETDRAAIYQLQDDGTGTVEWWLVMCRPLRTADAKPGDLGTNDAGFTWFDQVEGIYWRWSGGVWNYYIGSYVNTYANMPAAAEADRGFLFIASNYGEHVWRKGASAFELIEGMGGPMYGTAAERATTASALGANDTGFRFTTTDQGWQTWRWIGTAFALVPGSGEPMRATFANRPATLGVNDEGFMFLATDRDEIVWRWSGTAWVLQEGFGGPYRVAWASLPATFGANDAGFLAQITDRGDYYYRWSGSAWVLQIGHGGAMQGTVVSADQRPTLGANDTGFEFYGTDNRIRYRWSGAAWGEVGAYDGTYTPSLTNVTNVSASTAYQCQYSRTGNTVTVSGKVDIDITTATSATELGISLPIASNIGAEEDCSGTAACPDSTGLSAAILGDAANNRAALSYVANADDGDLPFFFTFTYQVI